MNLQQQKTENMELLELKAINVKLAELLLDSQGTIILLSYLIRGQGGVENTQMPLQQFV